MRRLFVTCVVAVLCLTQTGQIRAETIRLLTVGNSFADNALTYLPQIVDSTRHKLIVERANLGGCTLERHWRHAMQHEKDPTGKEGSPYQGGKYSLAQLLAKEQWDYITLQQVSYQSHDLETYYPFATNLYGYIKERAPQARMMLHQIWAYRVDDPRFTPQNKGKEPHTQRLMYEQVRKAYHTIAGELRISIIPSGDAMFLADIDPKWGYRPDTGFDFSNAKPPALPNQSHSLQRGWYWSKEKDGSQKLAMDGHHASNAGKYLLGCVWYEALYGEPVPKNVFVPGGMEASYASFLREVAHRAFAQMKSTP